MVAPREREAQAGNTLTSALEAKLHLVVDPLTQTHTSHSTGHSEHTAFKIYVSHNICATI